jgi:hypothetical protein
MVAPTETLESVRLTPETLLPDLLRAHPSARAVFDRYGLRGCGGRYGPVETIGFFARTHGVDEAQLLAELAAATGAVTVDGPCRGASSGHACDEGHDHPHARASQAASRDRRHDVADDRAPAVADTIYRRFFLGGIVLILTAGATWGAWLLWQIGFAGKFTGVSVHHVNAHGHAQIYGWVGLFIMGFAYQAFPRIWHTELRAPRLAVASFALMAFGLVVRTVGMTMAGAWDHALCAAMVGGAAEAASVLLFVGIVYDTFRRSTARLEPYVGFVLGGLGWFVAMTAMDVWHTYTTMTAATHERLVWYVATYQAPLRDLQIHGLALFMILGVSLRMLPALFGVPAVPARRAWRALGVLTAAVVLESVLFVAYRWSGNHALAGLLMVPWIMLAVGAAMVVLPWRLWRPFQTTDRSAKFVRAAYAWLALSLVMLLLLPVYQAASGIPFSHAYYGGIRHAITVGFISLMIMGMAAKVVPTLNGRDTRALSRLWGPFLLVNVGCFLRVSTQTLTDWHPAFFGVVGVSGLLEVTGLGWWGLGLAAIMRQGKREAAATDEASNGTAAAPRPARLEPAHCVADVVRWFPQTLPVFERYGFTLLRRPALRRTIARGVTVARAAAFRGVDEAELLGALNAAAGCERPAFASR